MKGKCVYEEDTGSILSLSVKDPLEEALGAIILIAALIDVTLQVLTRILPVYAFPWTVELGQILLGALIWIGIGSGVLRDDHVGLDFAVKRLPLKWGKIIFIIDNIFFITFLFILIFMTVLLINNYINLDTKTTVLKLNLYWVRSPIIIGCSIGIIRIISKIIYTIKGYIQPFSYHD